MTLQSAKRTSHSTRKTPPRCNSSSSKRRSSQSLGRSRKAPPLTTVLNGEKANNNTATALRRTTRRSTWRRRLSASLTNSSKQSRGQNALTLSRIGTETRSAYTQLSRTFSGDTSAASRKLRFGFTRSLKSAEIRKKRLSKKCLKKMELSATRSPCRKFTKCFEKATSMATPCQT